MAIKIQTAKGDIKISTGVLIKIVATIASGCYGVIGLTAGNKGVILNPDSIASLSKGVKIRAEHGKISINLHIASTYGINMHTASESIRNNVTYQIEHFTGVEVGKFNIHIETIKIVD